HRGRGRRRAARHLPAVRWLPPAAERVRARGHARPPRAARRAAADSHARRAAAARLRTGGGRVTRQNDVVARAASALVDRAGRSPRVGIVLGSGLGAVAEAVADPQVIAYEEL